MATRSRASMSCTQQLVAEIDSTDADGNPTDPNSIVWTSSDESVAVVVPVAGGLKAHIIAGNVGDCKVVVNANAVKGGKGAKPVLGVLDLTVHSGEVAEVKITTGTPVEQGTAPDNSLPSRPPRPNAGLPNAPGIDNTLPGGPPVRPEAGLPWSPGRPDAGLPTPPAGTKPTPPEGGTKPVGEEEGEHIPSGQPKRR